MQYVIFGTGKFAKVYSKCLNSDEIYCYIDNDCNKQGQLFNEKKVYSPNEVNYNEVKYIIIMVSKYKEIVSQLVEMGIKKEKIISYREMGRRLGLSMYVNHCDKQIEIGSWKLVGKKIFIMIHELSRTGVPVAAMHLAELFRELGYGVVIGSLRNGSIINELREKKIPYIENMGAFYNCSNFKSFIDSFDCLIMGTLGVVQYAVNFESYNKPIFWWINETHANSFETHELPKHRDNLYYFADGDKAVRMFKLYYPERKVKNLYYFLPDEEIISREIKENNRICFGMVGTHTRRKGQDILVDAIKMIPGEIRKKMIFYIIGPEDETYTKEWKYKAERIPEIKMIDELSQLELIKMYSIFDVLICPSRDDTEPIVVTQAFQNYIPCIVSDQVGQSIYMKDDYGGYVFDPGDTRQLCDAIISMYYNDEKREQQGQEGRAIFEKHFSKNAVRNEILSNMVSHLL